MKPLQSVAMGLVIIVVTARFQEYDALADPLGWVLVWLGVRALPTDLTHRSTLLGLSVLAGAVAAVVWFPRVADGLYAADPSLAWAANLPQLLFSALLCHVLAARAAGAGDGKAARWLSLVRTVLVVVGLLPVLVFGAGLDSLEQLSYVAAAIAALVLIWLLFAHAARPWARPIRESRARSASTS
jgi:Na+-driven multidrug efflux pump